MATLPVLNAKEFGAHGMTDAEKAYQIAEERIARAQTEGLTYLCLAETPGPDNPVKWDKEEALKHLATIPPSISSLTELKRLDLNRTQVADLSPLAGMVEMQTLYLNDTQVTDLSPLAELAAMQTLSLNNTNVADLSPLTGLTSLKTLRIKGTRVSNHTPILQIPDLRHLWIGHTDIDLFQFVSEGVIWENDDRELSTLECEGLVEDTVIEAENNRSSFAPPILARLRELRDMAPPAAPQDREDGAKLDLDDHGALALSDPALGDADQDDLSEELQDACAALSASLATNNQFAHTRGRSDRLMRLLANPPSDAGAERAWALVNALRDDHEGHLDAAKANDAGEIGAAEAMLPPVAAPKLATVARIAGVWLMGYPGVAAVERKYAEYETGARVEESVDDAETLLNDVSSDMTEEAATFAQDLLTAAKHATRAGGRAAKAVGAFAYNTAAFLIRSAYRVGKVVKGALEFVGSATQGAMALGTGVALLLAHEAAVTAWVAAQAPGMMPALQFVLNGLRAIGL